MNMVVRIIFDEQSPSYNKDDIEFNLCFINAKIMYVNELIARKLPPVPLKDLCNIFDARCADISAGSELEKLLYVVGFDECELALENDYSLKFELVFQAVDLDGWISRLKASD